MKKIIILSFTFILIIICIFLYPNITSTKKIITNNQESTIQFENKTIAEDGTITQINNMDSL